MQASKTLKKMSSNTFYNKIREKSFAKLASDEALKTEWINANWTPVADRLIASIDEASESGKFKVIIEVDSKSFFDAMKSPCEEFRNSWRAAIQGFIDLISNSKYDGPRSDPFKVQELKTLSWSKKGALNGFKIKGECRYQNRVHFDISWD